jgi:hypothetical protein
MAKRTNRLASGLVAVLAVVIMVVAVVAAHLIYGVVSVRVTTTGLIVTSIGEFPAFPGLKVMGGFPVHRWPGQTFYSCGPGGSRITQIYRQGDVVKAICHRITFFPWVRG